MKTVIIVGGGFGGINAAKILARSGRFRVIVLDRRNHHLFQPLLYQVATAGLSPAEIAMPIRAIVGRYNHCEVYLAEVLAVDLDDKLVKTDFADFSYDYLILACGAQHSYFGHNEWEDFAPGLKTIEQAREIRRRIFLAFERAERERDPVRREQLLSFVVVGGGPTGVELAGTLGEISRYALSKEFCHIDPCSTRIILVEAGPTILPSFSEKSRARAVSDLASLGVQVLTNSKVENIDANGVHMGDRHIDAATVLWAAGVKPSKLCTTLGVPLDRVGRVVVEPMLNIKHHDTSFVIGDMASFHGPKGPLPGVAPVAIQQGRAVAENIIRDEKGKARKTFVYVDKGQLATIGRSHALLEYKSFRLGGLIAWIGWLLVHIYYLIGFKNRLMVMIQWAFAFINFRRGVRIIHTQEWKSEE